MNQEFWTVLEELVGQSDVVIDRPKGSAHPKFPHTIYPVDYGYLQNTTSMDGEGIDVWVGTAGADRGRHCVRGGCLEAGFGDKNPDGMHPAGARPD